MTSKRPSGKIEAIAFGPISLVPIKEEHNVQYYNIITHEVNGKILKRKIIIVATIRRTTRNCTIVFQGDQPITLITYNIVNNLFRSISEWHYWYNFKLQKWFGSGLPKQHEKN